MQPKRKRQPLKKPVTHARHIFVQAPVMKRRKKRMTDLFVQSKKGQTTKTLTVTNIS